MKYPIIVTPFLKVDGMAVFPFILVKKPGMRQDQVLIRHEIIHLRQAAELLVIPFYILYLVNYIINRFKYDNHHQAYMHIIFEKEAYHQERNITYLQTRRLYAWVRYFKQVN